MLTLQNHSKIVYYLFFGALVSMILHNGIYALFGFEEGIFFILTLLCGFGAFGYSMYLLVLKILKKNIVVWQIGWLGIVLLVFFLVIGVNKYWIFMLPVYYLLFFVFKWLK
jgi:hypothetical protein